MKKAIYILFITALMSFCFTDVRANIICREVKDGESLKITELKVIDYAITVFAEWVKSESYLNIGFEDFLYTFTYTQKRLRGHFEKEAREFAEVVELTMHSLQLYEDKKQLIKEVNNNSIYKKHFTQYVNESYSKEEFFVYMVDNGYILLQNENDSIRKQALKKSAYVRGKRSMNER